jgi:hypothetical protein
MGVDFDSSFRRIDSPTRRKRWVPRHATPAKRKIELPVLYLSIVSPYLSYSACLPLSFGPQRESSLHDLFLKFAARFLAV